MMTMLWALVTLTALEIVLGIDNIVLLSILVERLPSEQQASARKIGLGLALVARLVLLASAVWLIGLTEPVLIILHRGLSIRDLVLIAGGLFLMAKATSEIFHFVEGEGTHSSSQAPRHARYGTVLFQIIVFDLIFSLDSVLTAVGLTDQLGVMSAAVIIAVILMILFANAVSVFVKNNPAIKLLALSFLVMIGLLLIAEGLGSHFERGYVYFAMAFSLVIEMLNRRRHKKITKHS